MALPGEAGAWSNISSSEPGPPRYIFERQDHHCSGGHITLMPSLPPPRSILKKSRQDLSLAGLTSSDGPDWTFATEKKLRYTLDLRQAPRQKQHTTALQVFDFLGFRKSAGMVAKEKLSQLDVTYCLTFILLESFNNSRNSTHSFRSQKQRPWSPTR